MDADLYLSFLDSEDTLRIYADEELVYSSEKDRLLPLLEYLEDYDPEEEAVTVFDKVMGNGAALLAVKANCREVFSPLGSELAIDTLENYKVAYHINKVVPHIKRPGGKDMCPMEKLSINKTPEQFYQEMKARFKANQ